MQTWDVKIRCKDCGKQFKLIGKQCEDLLWIIDKRGLPHPFYYCKKCLRETRHKFRQSCATTERVKNERKTNDKKTS